MFDRQEFPVGDIGLCCQPSAEVSTRPLGGFGKISQVERVIAKHACRRDKTGTPTSPNPSLIFVEYDADIRDEELIFFLRLQFLELQAHIPPYYAVAEVLS